VSSSSGLLVIENLSDDRLEDVDISIRSAKGQPAYTATYKSVDPRRSLRATLRNFTDSSGHRWDAFAQDIYDVKIDCMIHGRHIESVVLI
jgi:hypothetical protein